MPDQEPRALERPASLVAPLVAPLVSTPLVPPAVPRSESLEAELAALDAMLPDAADARPADAPAPRPAL